MKLLITFNYFEGEFLLKKSNILEEKIIFKDKKQQSKLYLLELFNTKFYFALLGITQVIAMPTLQKILCEHPEIDDTLVFGSAGSYDYNVGKLVLIDSFNYNNDILNKYFSMNVKLPKWIKKTNTLPKLEVFTATSVNDIEKPAPQQNTVAANCFDMETSEIAYLLKINKISGVFFRIITDFGEIDFQEIKKVYSSQIENLLIYIESFLVN
jgi:nucleoside phosphorylase